MRFPSRSAWIRGSLLLPGLVLLPFAACKKEEPPAQYPVAQGTGGGWAYPPPTGPEPSAPASTAPPPATTSPPAGPNQAAGFPCNYDTDLQCPFGRCLGNRCGGCSSEADCKPGAACLSTPMGQACMPGTPPASTTPPSSPPPAAPPPTTPPPTTPPPAANDSFAQARERCVQKTNSYRATKNVAAVARRSDREKCGDKQAEADALASQPHGKFGKCGESAQNECPGWKGTPESTVDSCLQAMFDEGPGTGSAHGHYNNMMNSKYASVSCGFYVTADGSIWLVQDFYLR